MNEKKKYHVSAYITISLNAIVYASSSEEALALACELKLPNIYEDHRYDIEGESHTEWRTSGELDGEPEDILVEADK